MIYYLKIFTVLFAIVNPFGAMPLFVLITQNYSAKDRNRTIRIASITVFAVLTLSMLFGEKILGLFGITIASFRVAGGILMLLMALSMLQAQQPLVKQTAEEELEAEQKQAIGVVPLGLPIMAGPGAISSVILYSHIKPMAHQQVYLAVVIFGVAMTVFISLRLAPKISLIIGKTGINIITRIMGLIMAANGVEFIAQGLISLFPTLR